MLIIQIQDDLIPGEHIASDIYLENLLGSRERISWKNPVV